MYWTKVEPEPIPIPVVPGLLPTNTPEQNSLAIEKIINSLPVGAAKSIHIPSGNYHFARAILIRDRPIHLTGDNGTIWGNGTRFYFPKECAGILAAAHGMIIENISLFGGGNTVEWMDGILIRAITILRGVYVKGFYNGIEASCNIESEGTNCSGMLVEQCFAAENTNNGFHFQGTDANAITVIACDARDNGGFGFLDKSFLGNNFLSCMAHYNAKGDFQVSDWLNAQSLFMGCYSEGGSPTSKLGTHSTVIGGIWGSPYTIGEDQTLRRYSNIRQ